MRTPYVYVVTHPAAGSLKIGHGSEATSGPDRVENLGRYGWQLYRRLFVASPRQAFLIEQATLFEVRHRLHAPQYLPSGSIPVGGSTETVSVRLVPPRLAWDLLCEQAGLAWLASDQPKRRTSNRRHESKPISPADLTNVRELAEALGGTDRLSTRNIREAVGCRTEYAIRLRDAVRSEGDVK
jgi:hypothetical protein